MPCNLLLDAFVLHTTLSNVSRATNTQKRQLTTHTSLLVTRPRRNLHNGLLPVEVRHYYMLGTPCDVKAQSGNLRYSWQRIIRCWALARWHCSPWGSLCTYSTSAVAQVEKSVDIHSDILNTGLPCVITEDPSQRTIDRMQMNEDLK
ncbi:hypothetical protein GGR54DRAFT_461349 [Hypoxylon sp. NC1633]|nr:hypothetical protein GGR54DRAFT_461349 [Hypoxylon sp. NC1633]